MSIPFLLAVGDSSTQNLSIFDPVSPPAESIRHLSLLVLAITGGIFLVVEGVLFYSVFRFRRPHVPGASEPPQVYGSMPIEIAWTAAPALIVFVLTLVIARTEWEVRVDPSRPPPELQDAGRCTSPSSAISGGGNTSMTSDGGDDLGIVTANELHVPASNRHTAGERRPVFLTLQSADVSHSFWVPRLAGKTDLIPGRTNRMWFETERAEVFLGQCAEYCGTQHANMLLRVCVDPPEEFDRWLENEKMDARDSDDPEVRKGKQVFLAQSCVNCHRVRGTPARARMART